MSVRPGPDQARACVAESGSGSRLVNRRRVEDRTSRATSAHGVPQQAMAPSSPCMRCFPRGWSMLIPQCHSCNITSTLGSSNHPDLALRPTMPSPCPALCITPSPRVGTGLPVTILTLPSPPLPPRITNILGNYLNNLTPLEH
ncbi:hypothetical protein CROQUDRAFT_99958 [Cronartium quercuum f. sp. fusiforme G11]|uniref:Uncharacterized protein n=1 Tax=Cronartium quercuum f. sp. fusiforme G11 TaxID=708437 RepID=A0A9P6T683_9BASI|nr:hypothetical protein CROQUDRAFT_99958 [Cronartium quercuum f. sp. fusiforme G11]